MINLNKPKETNNEDVINALLNIEQRFDRSIKSLEKRFDQSLSKLENQIKETNEKINEMQKNFK